MPDESPSRPDRVIELLHVVRFAIGKLFGSLDKVPAVIISAALLVFAFRARASDIPVIAKTIITALGDNSMSILGWIVATMVVAFAVLLVLIMRSLYKSEIARVASERDRLQEILNNRPVQHSD